MPLWTMLLATCVAMPVSDLDWRTVNDTVMGGVSQSRVDIDETLKFRGTLSLERNGGFVSIRARPPRDAFVGATAIKLILDGDGRTYDLTLDRRDVPLMAGSYRVRVDTKRGKTEVEVPISAFRPTSFGRFVPGAPALDTGLENVVEVGVMLADKKPGAFELEILSMEVIRAAESALDDRPAAKQLMMSAIDGGVPLFNRGDAQGCAELYAFALGKSMEMDGLTAGEQSLIADALTDAARLRATDAAWTLRYAMDSILRSP